MLGADPVLVLLLATLAALVVFAWLRGRAVDEDFESSSDCSSVKIKESELKKLLQKIKNSARKGLSYKSMQSKFPEIKCWLGKDVIDGQGFQIQKAYDAGTADRKSLEGDIPSKSASCVYGKCPNTVLRATKPCRAKDTAEKCCVDPEGTDRCVKHKTTDLNWKCAQVPKSERECKPPGGKDADKFCYKGKALHNQGLCCEQPWSGQSGCFKEDPVAANAASSGAAPAGASTGPNPDPEKTWWVCLRKGKEVYKPDVYVTWQADRNKPQHVDAAWECNNKYPAECEGQCFARKAGDHPGIVEAAKKNCKCPAGSTAVEKKDRTGAECLVPKADTCVGNRCREGGADRAPCEK